MHTYNRLHRHLHAHVHAVCGQHPPRSQAPVTAENLPVARHLAVGAPAADGRKLVKHVALQTAPIAAGTTQLVKLADVADGRTEHLAASTHAQATHDL